MLKKGMLLASTLLLIFSCSESVTSDTTSSFNTYGGSYNDFGHNVLLTNDGGYLLVGKTYNKTSDADNQYDTYVVKVGSSGSQEASYALNDGQDPVVVAVNDALNAEISDVESTDDGGYILIGSKYNATTGWDILMVKITAAGILDANFSSDGVLTIDVGTDMDAVVDDSNQDNIAANSDDRGYSVAVNDDGSYTIAGIVHASAAGGYDIYVAPIPKDGTFAAGTDIGTVIEGDATAANDTNDLDDFAVEINKTVAGGYVLAGSIRTSADGSDMWLVEVTSSADEAAGTRMTFGQAINDEYGLSAIQAFDGGYAIAGYTYSSGSGQSDFYIEKTGGAYEWSRVIGGSNDDKANRIRQTSDGGYIVVGSTYSYGNGQSDIMLVKLDEEGNEEWRQTYGTVSDDFSTAVEQTPDGGYIISGYTLGSSMYDALLIKTNSVGVQEF